jgi:hypothetical protein
MKDFSASLKQDRLALDKSKTNYGVGAVELVSLEENWATS